MGIVKFVVRRLLFGLVTLFIVSVVFFVLSQALEDPARAILGRQATPEAVLQRSDYSGEQKRLILDRWLQDAEELSVAEEEGMAGGEASMIERVARGRSATR